MIYMPIFDKDQETSNIKSFAMEKAIRLKVRKDLDAQEQRTVLKLKGSLISKGYMEIIHILDHDDDFHINTIETELEKRNEVRQYITAFIGQENPAQAISIK